MILNDEKASAFFWVSELSPKAERKIPSVCGVGLGACPEGTKAVGRQILKITRVDRADHLISTIQGIAQLAVPKMAQLVGGAVKPA